jgi:hypothetical protein
MKSTISLIAFTFVSLFAAHAQSILSIAPNSAQQGDNLNVTVVGLNTTFTTGTPTAVWLTQGTGSIIQSFAVNAVAPTIMTASFNIPINATIGFWDVSSGSSTALSNGFEILAGAGGSPTVTSITANSATQGDNLTVTVIGTGTNWGQATGTTSMWIMQGTGTTIYGTSVTVLSTTALQATLNILGNANLGLYDVFVTATVPLIDGFEVLLDIGVEEYLNADHLKVYPNPATSASNLYFELKTSAKVHVEVFDMQGRSIGVILDQEQAAGSHNVALNAAKLGASGQYFARITVADKAAIVKFVYQK